MDQDSASTSPVVPAPTAPVSDVATPAPAADATSTSDPAAAASASDIPTPAGPTPAPSEPVSEPPVSDTTPIVEPSIPEQTEAPSVVDPSIPIEVAKKIAESQNVLIALSSDPSVDEMSAAIGLSLFLDKIGKRATAIYSGSTPNALEFLKPEETFESSTDTLQDFVIALNKEKADHLRYKLDGDYVKIYITPYKSRISSDDLEFSYGDFNIDLVLALDVANGIDLDAALREHGRIMHDAVIINITTGNPGRFGEIEWSNKSASSVSEMIAGMLYNTDSKDKIGKEEATAFLTGIVAATNRFSNASTTPTTMQIASDLMQSGANQQLISKNITPDVENEFYSILGGGAKKQSDDPTKLDIEHIPEEDEATPAGSGEEAPSKPSEPATTATDAGESASLLDDLKAAEASLSQAGSETVPDAGNKSVRLEDLDSNLGPTLPTVSPEAPLDTESSSAVPSQDIGIFDKPEKVLQPSSDASQFSSDSDTDKYSKMLEDAISDSTPGYNDEFTAPAADTNPALSMAPPVANAPEINGVPEINYMPMPGEEVLPPPPAPPIDMAAPAEASTAPAPSIAPAEPVTATEPAPVQTTEVTAPQVPQPVMQDQVYAPPVADPGAFKIPGT